MHQHYKPSYIESCYVQILEDDSIFALLFYYIHIKHFNKPDIVLKDLKPYKRCLINMFMLTDNLILAMQLDKLYKENNLEIEIRWHLNTTIIPVVVG